MIHKNDISENKRLNYKNFLMIVPPNITYKNFRHPTKNTKSWQHGTGIELGVIITDVPLGAMTICTWLETKYKMNSKLLDFNVEAHKTWNHPGDTSFESWFCETLSNLDFKPDLIGFSSLFVTGYKNLLLLGNISKALFPEATRFVGGNVATTMYKELFEDDVEDVFDAACYGEGELPLTELLESDNPADYLATSPSWITRKKIVSKLSFAHNFISDLDDIPPLDYGLLEIKDYQHSPTIKAYTQIEDKTNYITYMTSRGCPFLCTFCSAHTVHGRKMRYFSLERIKAELEDLQQQYQANTLVLEDDHFLSDKARAMTILKIARDLGMQCVFPNALALYALDKEMLLTLASVGIKQLTLAVESGSPRVLKQLMKKPLKIEITERVASDCYELDIYTDCNIIIGMPGETMEDIHVARKFLRDLPANWYRINVATPLAGSEMMELAVQNNHMVGDVREAGYKSCVIETEHFTPNEINEIAYELNLELNFVHNTDMQKQNYVRAAESFMNVISLKSDHAFAWHFLSICHDKIGDQQASDKCKNTAIEIFKNDQIWNFYYKKFNLCTQGDNIVDISQELGEEKGLIFRKITSGIGRYSVTTVN